MNENFLIGLPETIENNIKQITQNCWLKTTYTIFYAEIEFANDKSILLHI